MITTITKLIATAFQNRKDKNTNKNVSAKKEENAKNETLEIIKLTSQIYVPNEKLEKLLGFKFFDAYTDTIREDLTDDEIDLAIVLFFKEYLSIKNYVDLYAKYIDGLDIINKCPNFNDLFPVSGLKNMYVFAMEDVDNLDECVANYMSKHTTREEKFKTLKTTPNLPSYITSTHLHTYKYAVTKQMHDKVSEMANV